MTETLKVALDITETALKTNVLACLAEMSDVSVHDRLDRGRGREEMLPNLLIFNAVSGSEDIAEKIVDVRQNLPQAAIFVISPDKTPEHVVDIMKAGADEFFSNPLNSGRLKAAVEKFRQKLALLAPSGKGRLFSFVSAKGGLGATVVSVNIASALAMKSKESVGLLDMSLQSGDSSVYLDTVPATTLAEVCKNFHRLDFSFLKTSMQRHSTGLHYLAAPKLPEDSGSVQGVQVKKVFELAKALYDYVVVDCTSMQVDECSLEAFRASERIFLLTDLSVPAIRNAARLNQLMQKLQIPSQKVEIVVNRFIKGTSSLSDVEKSLQKKIYWLFPNDFSEVIDSINSGVPLVKSKPGTAFARNISEFVEKLKTPASYANYRGAKGFLGKAI